mmetsp:Transcript_24579/g.80299  ORF Transcript_24579/g.80299 Transcript_24579/m.80299 type:complete len:280 (+) Transcript_24579:260-1099(+)
MRAAMGGQVGVKRFAESNTRLYKTIPLSLPDGWRSDMNYSARTDQELVLDALPTKEGALVGVLLFRPGDERVEGLRTGPEAKAFFEEYFPMFKGWVSDSAFEDFARKRVSRLPSFTFAGPDLHREGRSVIVGDEVKTVKPYFGLGVNSAFEDIGVLEGCIDESGEDLAQALPLYSQRRAKEARALTEMSVLFDKPGKLGTIFCFIGPIILDAIFSKALPWLFAPNPLQLLQNENLSFTQVRWRKRRDRALQLALIGAVVAGAAKLAYVASKLALRLIAA